MTTAPRVFVVENEALIEMGHGRDFIMIGDDGWKKDIEARLERLGSEFGSPIRLARL